MSLGENVPGVNWLLVVTRLSDRVPEHFHPVLTEYTDISERERRLGIKGGTPIIVSPQLEIDPLLTDFFSRSAFTGKSESTRSDYAAEIKTWCAFLDASSLHWTEAVESHYLDFFRYRTDPDLHEVLPGEKAPVIAEASFKKTRYALEALYNWALKNQYVTESPVPEKHITGRANRAPEGSASDKPRDKWVTPRTYQLWRNVGVLGQAAARSGRALEWAGVDPSFRGGRNHMRDHAFCDLMITSALRRGEQSTLLVPEVPESGEDADVLLAGAVAKYRKARIYTPQSDAVALVHEYIRLGRSAAVARAKRNDRYDGLASKQVLLVAREVNVEANGIFVELETGESKNVAGLNAQSRMRLFQRDEAGRLEPLWLWLGDDGKPMQPRAWNAVFDRANDRMTSEYRRLGLSPLQSPQLSPHSLRFTFALYLLAALHRRIDEREGLTESSAYDEKRYEAAYDVVRDMLGHSHVSTTKDTYLEPVKGLRRSVLFDDAVRRDLAEVIGLLTHESDRVLDSGSVFEEED